MKLYQLIILFQFCYIVILTHFQEMEENIS